MSSSPAKRRKLSPTSYSLEDATTSPARQISHRADNPESTPRRASFLSPTKASLARFNSNLVSKSSTSKSALFGSPAVRPATASGNSHSSNARNFSRYHSPGKVPPAGRAVPDPNPARKSTRHSGNIMARPTAPINADTPPSRTSMKIKDVGRLLQAGTQYNQTSSANPSLIDRETVASWKDGAEKITLHPSGLFALTNFPSSSGAFSSSNPMELRKPPRTVSTINVDTEKRSVAWDKRRGLGPSDEHLARKILIRDKLLEQASALQEDLDQREAVHQLDLGSGLEQSSNYSNQISLMHVPFPAKISSLLTMDP
ncbi:MAG: hypothetical protein M1829_001285 [Trizodia sp. TS-e1964]|nr:MAG: hypothetical protein M1829_001285 [Trizodia sp. TS-e1964]